jgi:hypothetical protein
MKKIIFIIMLSIFVLSCASAQAKDVSTAVNEGLGFKFGVGQDNAYLCQNGTCYFAVGGGFNILGYEKAVGTKGSILDLTLHATALVKATGGEAGTLLGLSANLDLVKLITGTGIKIFIPELSCVVGPIVAYDITKGNIAYGGVVNVNYMF